MEHHLSLHTRFSTILYMLLPSMGANKVLGEVHGEKHNHGRGKWSIHCHWTAWIKAIRDCLSRHGRQHIFMEDTLSLARHFFHQIRYGTVTDEKVVLQRDISVTTGKMAKGCRQHHGLKIQ